MILFYDTFLCFYHLAIRIAACFYPKARKWVDGRKGQWAKISREMAAAPSDRPIVWAHCASVGEFEQGRPVLEALRAEPSQPFIVLTFYSPSGFESLRNTPLADRVYYLPADGASNARKFLDLVRPDLAVFVKYEFWHHYIGVLRQRNIPHFLIGSIFRPNQYFFTWWGRAFRKSLAGFERLFVQDNRSAQLLQSVGITRVSVCGDPRADRVSKLPETPFSDPFLEAFAAQGPLWVWGSTWPPDEALLLEALQTAPEQFLSWRFLIVPHEPSEAHVRRLTQQFHAFGAKRYSEKAFGPEDKVLIVDTLGLLSRVYRLGQLAYVGGGFGRGIHNILEPAAYGVPVFIGPRYHKFLEAKKLIEAGGAFSVKKPASLIAAFDQMQDKVRYEAAQTNTRQYLLESQGATHQIMVALGAYLMPSHSADAANEQKT